jgi:hypothetical protein
MGIRVEIQDKLRKEMLTKIHGQPTNHNLTIIKKELIAILASIVTALGGGNHGHAGVIIEPAAYSNMTDGIDFANPMNPEIYPTELVANAATGTRARAEVEHKELFNQFEIFEGVCQGTKDTILKAVDNEYLVKIKHKTLEYLNLCPRQILCHFLTRGGALDIADTKELLAERDGE